MRLIPWKGAGGASKCGSPKPTQPHFLPSILPQTCHQGLSLSARFKNCIVLCLMNEQVIDSSPPSGKRPEPTQHDQAVTGRFPENRMFVRLPDICVTKER